MKKVLVIDDDDKILELIEEILTLEGFEVHTRTFIEEINLDLFGKYDLIILDIMLPYFDGYEILESIKNIVICPIIFVSAKSSEDDKVKGLMSGADDYITKPFGLKELVARVKVALRKNKNELDDGKIVIDDLVFDINSNSISKDSSVINMTNNEFKICRILIQNKGKIFSKNMLYEYLYDMDSETQLRTITEFIYSIRKKFNEVGLDPIKTIWGIGYKWDLN